MANETLNIDELILSVQKLGEQEASGIGQEVGRGIIDRLSFKRRDRYIPLLNLSVTVPSGTSKSEIAKLISEAILKRLV